MKPKEITKKNIIVTAPPYVESVLKKFKKNANLCSIGEIEQNVYLIASGIIEVGLFADNEDKIIEFVLPNEYTSSLSSLLSQQPSDVYIKCLTDCEVWVISFSKLREASKTSLEASQSYIQAIEKAYIHRVQREKDFLTLNAEERYLKLMETRPEIIKLIPIFRIAKYIGIHPDSLSRIRKTKFGG